MNCANTQLCASLFIFVQRRRDVPCYSSSPSSPSKTELLVDSAPALPTVMVVAVAHPLMSKFSNKCFCLGSLLCVVSSCFRSITCLSSLPPHRWLCCQHWLAFALTNHAPPNTLPPILPSSSPPPPFTPLKIMPGCCDDDFLLCCAPTSCLLRSWHPTLPMSCTDR